MSLASRERRGFAPEMVFAECLRWRGRHERSVYPTGHPGPDRALGGGPGKVFVLASLASCRQGV